MWIKPAMQKRNKRQVQSPLGDEPATSSTNNASASQSKPETIETVHPGYREFALDLFSRLIWHSDGRQTASVAPHRGAWPKV